MRRAVNNTLLFSPPRCWWEVSLPLAAVCWVVWLGAETAALPPCNATAQEESRWVHPLCQPLAIDSNGPFVELADGSLMTIDPRGTRCSQDDGQTWSEVRSVCEGLDGLREGREPASASILRTRGGALVIVYLDSTTFNFSWDNTINQPKDDCRLEIWAIRSLDGGQTWIDRQRILEGYNPNFFGFIQTRGGRLVATVPHLVRDPGRYVACSLTSDDDGKTWQRSNLVDLGGHGHHSGAMEPTVAELGDGRLLMLIRTHWGRFWEALSDDGGLSWRTDPAEPDRIDQRAGLLTEAAQRPAGFRGERPGRACQSLVGFFRRRWQDLDEAGHPGQPEGWPVELSVLLGTPSRRTVGHCRICLQEGLARAFALKAENRRGSVSQKSAMKPRNLSAHRCDSRQD